MLTTVECINRLEAIIDELLEEGADPTFILAAIGEAAAHAASKDPVLGAMHLENLALVLSAASVGMKDRLVFTSPASTLPN